ncbi:site-specific integrase [Microlunatus endophyticus]|uniref:Site-specific integrase n=1 Tax=Microlunatus endophyticus TaxID=1716077 RepID=A0A917W597_9ACTN|nr:site-specific integrase [Microlunatus endophyticus]GGL70621.1 site-specific integrase [Microlunatus endophyticus]
MTKREQGAGSLFWNEARKRWIVSVTVGYDGSGRRIARRASARTRTEAKAKLRELIQARDAGTAIQATKAYTVGDAVKDWLDYGLGDVGPSTANKYRSLASRHITPLLGKRKLKDLTAGEVDRWIASRAEVLSSEPLRRVHACLNRSVRRAMARDLVQRNVVELVKVPPGRGGRPSKSLTPEIVDQVLTLTVDDPLHAYIVVSLLTGGRTEELRALQWSNVHLDESRVGNRVVPSHLEVWRSVRSTGDTKTRRSRRTLALPVRCVGVLRRHRAQQDRQRLAAGDQWHDTDLVFTTDIGGELDAASVRRDFRRALGLVPGINPDDWTPREMRHSFVSILSDAGVPLEEISRLVGHSGTAVTELVYRHQLRPVIESGATVMDQLFREPPKQC